MHRVAAGLLALTIGLPAAQGGWISVSGGDVAALREAIQRANEEPGFDEIAISGDFVFSLDDELPPIRSHIRLEGSAQQTHLMAAEDGGPDRLLSIEPGAVLELVQMELSGFTLVRRGVDAELERSPLITNHGQLTITSVQAFDIWGQWGGGTFGLPVSHNEFILNRGELRVFHSSFIDIGLSNWSDNLLVNEGLAELRRIVIQGEKIGTPVHNHGELRVENITFKGRGSHPLVEGDGTTTILNSIFAAVDGDWCAEVVSLGYNLIEDATCNWASEGDLVGVPAGLLPLRLELLHTWGGRFRVFPLSAASPAIDSAAPDTHCTARDGDGDGIADCDRGALEYEPMRLSDGGANGLYYDPNQDGHYLYVLDNDHNTLLVWNTFDVHGNQAWVLGLGDLAGGRSMIADAYINQNGRLTETGPVDVERDVYWGKLQLELDDCMSGQLYFTSDLPDFTSGQVELRRLAKVEQIGCRD